MPKDLEATTQKLVPGRRYRVSLEDCCVQGYFVGTFLGWEPPDWTEGEGPDKAKFDVGEIGPDWGAWEAEEVKDA